MLHLYELTVQVPGDGLVVVTSASLSPRILTCRGERPPGSSMTAEKQSQTNQLEEAPRIAGERAGRAPRGARRREWEIARATREILDSHRPDSDDE